MILTPSTTKQHPPHDALCSSQYGLAILHPSAVYCSTLPVDKSVLFDKYSAADSVVAPDDVKFVIGTQPFYVFMRLHLLIVQRLAKAKELSKVREGEAQVTHPSVAIPTIEEEVSSGEERSDFVRSCIVVCSKLASLAHL